MPQSNPLILCTFVWFVSETSMKLYRQYNGKVSSFHSNKLLQAPYMPTPDVCGNKEVVSQNVPLISLLSSLGIVPH
jgi:hypothetical protein